MSPAPLVSVVTPFYNTQKFLAECIESVLGQSYENWEYILVDNCSSDGSSEIASQYAARFPNKIRFISTPSFLSQVQNYNFALSQILPESEYCKMVQADDWLFPDCIRSMVEVAESYPTVGIVAGYELEGDEIRLDGLPYPSPMIDGRHACRLYFLEHKYLFGTPTSLLMRSDLVRSRTPFYDEQYSPFEDGHACFDLLANCDFGFVHQVLTYSRRDNGGIISRVRPFGLDFFLHFSMLVAHGRKYLSRTEYDRCLTDVERRYFRWLARHACAIKRMDREFWDFHRRGLASVGVRLDRKCLRPWIPRALCEKAWDVFWAWWDKDARPPVNDGCVLQEGRAVCDRRAR